VREAGCTSVPSAGTRANWNGFSETSRIDGGGGVHDLQGVGRRGAGADRGDRAGSGVRGDESPPLGGQMADWNQARSERGEHGGRGTGRAARAPD
jgi:hypothetical protein